MLLKHVLIISNRHGGALYDQIFDLGSITNIFTNPTAKPRGGVNINEPIASLLG